MRGGASSVAFTASVWLACAPCHLLPGCGAGPALLSECYSQQKNEASSRQPVDINMVPGCSQDQGCLHGTTNGHGHQPRPLLLHGHRLDYGRHPDMADSSSMGHDLTMASGGKASYSSGCSSPPPLHPRVSSSTFLKSLCVSFPSSRHHILAHCSGSRRGPPSKPASGYLPKGILLKTIFHYVGILGWISRVIQIMKIKPRRDKQPKQTHNI